MIIFLILVYISIHNSHDQQNFNLLNSLKTLGKSKNLFRFSPIQSKLTKIFISSN